MKKNFSNVHFKYFDKIKIKFPYKIFITIRFKINNINKFFKLIEKKRENIWVFFFLETAFISLPHKKGKKKRKLLCFYNQTVKGKIINKKGM